MTPAEIVARIQRFDQPLGLEGAWRDAWEARSLARNTAIRSSAKGDWEAWEAALAIEREAWANWAWAGFP